MADYTDYGYSSTLVRTTAQSTTDDFMFPVDSQLMIGGIGAGKISKGALQQDIVLDGGRIIINDNESGTVITIGNLE